MTARTNISLDLLTCTGGIISEVEVRVAVLNVRLPVLVSLIQRQSRVVIQVDSGKRLELQKKRMCCKNTQRVK